MKTKIGVLALLMMAALLVLAGCSPQQSVAVPTGSSAPVVQTADSAAASGELLLTLEELAAYNGKDGKPAYVAVDGVIYDVTNIPQWKNGQHNGFEAGQDLTAAIKEQSPHGVSKLQNVPVAGKIKE